MEELRQALTDCHLHEVKASGPLFMLERGLKDSHIIREQLDRYVYNASWFNTYKSYKACNIGRLCSDHSPILLNMIKKPLFVGETDKGRRLEKF